MDTTKKTIIDQNKKKVAEIDQQIYDLKLAREKLEEEIQNQNKPIPWWESTSCKMMFQSLGYTYDQGRYWKTFDLRGIPLSVCYVPLKDTQRFELQFKGDFPKIDLRPRRFNHFVQTKKEILLAEKEIMSWTPVFVQTSMLLFIKDVADFSVGYGEYFTREPYTTLEIHEASEQEIAQLKSKEAERQVKVEAKRSKQRELAEKSSKLLGLETHPATH